jgi:hypothetical protein
MLQLAVLVAVFLFLGLKERTSGGSTHLTIVVVSALTIAFTFITLRSAP